MARTPYIAKWLAILTTLISVFMMATVVQANEASEPEAIVKDATDKMLLALKENEAELDADPSKIYGLVQEILLPNFDFSKMSKLALGKNWKQATPEQQEQFTEEFRLLLVRTYSTAMLEYTSEEIRFLPFRSDLSKKKVKVPMEITQVGGPSIPMTLSLYQNQEDEWKVYDMKINGISLVTNYRSTFATEIRNDGMDKLIERLAARNEKVKV